MKLVSLGLGLALCVLGYVVFFDANIEPSSVESEVLGATSPAIFTHNENAPDPNVLLSQINYTRVRYGLPKVRADYQLTDIAEQRMKDMQSQRYYAHQSPQTGAYYYDLLRTNGTRKSFSCENLNLSPKIATESYVMEWLNSHVGHKKCMLSSKSTKIGIAIDSMNLSGIAPQYIVVTIYQE